MLVFLCAGTFLALYRAQIMTSPETSTVPEYKFRLSTNGSIYDLNFTQSSTQPVDWGLITGYQLLLWGPLLYHTRIQAQPTIMVLCFEVGSWPGCSVYMQLSVAYA